jgi:hypothetical protein
MAEGVMDLKLPILFIIPKHRDYSFIKESFKEGETREAFFMGLVTRSCQFACSFRKYIMKTEASHIRYSGQCWGLLQGM